MKNCRLRTIGYHLNWSRSRKRVNAASLRLHDFESVNSEASCWGRCKCHFVTWYRDEAMVVRNTDGPSRLTSDRPSGQNILCDCGWIVRGNCRRRTIDYHRHWMNRTNYVSAASLRLHDLVIVTCGASRLRWCKCHYVTWYRDETKVVRNTDGPSRLTSDHLRGRSILSDCGWIVNKRCRRWTIGCHRHWKCSHLYSAASLRLLYLISVSCRASCCRWCKCHDVTWYRDETGIIN